MPKHFSDVYEAWCFLESHPLVYDDKTDTNMFGKCFTVEVAKLIQIGEESWSYDPDVSPRIFLGFLQWVFPTDLDESDRKEFPEGKAKSVGLTVPAETFEEALIKLANLVLEKFGDWCQECGEWRKEDSRVKAGMKCGPCAYGRPSSKVTYF